jgi:hypothetical protein
MFHFELFLFWNKSQKYFGYVVTGANFRKGNSLIIQKSGHSFMIVEVGNMSKCKNFTVRMIPGGLMLLSK